MPHSHESLGKLSEGRDNNFNLIRMVATAMVLASHSYVVTSGDIHSEPWVGLLGMTPGGVAVDGFFALSGFLVTGSLLRSDALRSFAVARALRIYPALWVALVVSTLVIGLSFSEFRFAEFISHPQTWRYLLKNATMLMGSEAFLPGAFAHNPFSMQVNVSLWTLRWELRLYVLVALMWWCTGRWRRGSNREATMAALVLGTAVVLLATTIALMILGKPNDAPRLGSMFFSGAAYWSYRRHIRIRGDWTLIMVAMMGAAMCLSPHAFELVYRLCFPYLLFFLAFIPGRALNNSSSVSIRNYNRVGDYSYGMYVYAFPIQQIVTALMPGIGTWALTGVAGALTLLLSIVSWHMVEKPAMALKQSVLRRVPMWRIQN
ncbi:peptidoglycan/LPS O-acetylase OafA/YrhL [Variovorax boronicumulans]|uniref:acyltransferase family protein n=1 Tax=Variovorax boronicumulans TaxID=436515 RepID=UPI003395E285